MTSLKVHGYETPYYALYHSDLLAHVHNIYSVEVQGKVSYNISEFFANFLANRNEIWFGLRSMNFLECKKRPSKLEFVI